MDLKERREVFVRSCCRMIETGMYQSIGHRASGIGQQEAPRFTFLCIYSYLDESITTNKAKLVTAQHGTA